MGGICGLPKRRPLRTSDILNWIAVILAVTSVLTFALVIGAGIDIAWLAIALGEALVALALLIWRG